MGWDLDTRLASSGALSPAPGHNLTLSKRIGILMCPGKRTMESISWEDWPARTRAYLLRRMGHQSMGLFSILQRK